MMKSGWIAILAVFCIATQAYSADNKTLKTDKDKISYILGINMGEHFKRDSIDINVDILMKGFKDALSGAKPMLSEEEMGAAMTKFQQELAAKQMEKAKAIGEKNAKEGGAFLEANKKKDGVITLKSGLQYKVLTEGTGKMPKESDTVTTHYRGTLIDGTEFDSSYKRNEPVSFQVNGVIPGWTEALQLMKAGSKWQLFIPPDLAYGERGAAPIGPNATLIFDVELISVTE
ncbi:MAG: FKBP-type peptidyl-prolyl cis-trans isomerase [Desulfobacula sp.]|jgi:FKBP-type peptidyl-prolyl cis-trans isomerase